MNFFNSKENIILKNKNMNNIYIWILLGVVMLVAGNVFSGFGSKKNLGKESTNICKVQNDNDQSKYIENFQFENGLSEILSKVKGVGRVNVKINFKNSAVKIFEKDTCYIRDELSDKFKTEQNEKTVMSGQNSNQEPVVAYEKRPEIDGVLIVATGASDENIKLELQDAIKSVLGIPAHRIKVMARVEEK